MKDYWVNPKEKGFYTIFIKGIDRASNAGISDSLTSVTFDITPPEFSFSYPSNDLPVNTTKISFKLSEELEKGSITWIATKGDDPLSPHTKDLEGDQKKEGEKLDIISSTSGSDEITVWAGIWVVNDKGSYIVTLNILDVNGSKVYSYFYENELFFPTIVLKGNSMTYKSTEHYLDDDCTIKNEQQS